MPAGHIHFFSSSFKACVHWTTPALSAPSKTTAMTVESQPTKPGGAPPTDAAPGIPQASGIPQAGAPGPAAPPPAGAEPWASREQAQPPPFPPPPQQGTRCTAQRRLHAPSYMVASTLHPLLGVQVPQTGRHRPCTPHLSWGWQCAGPCGRRSRARSSSATKSSGRSPASSRWAGRGGGGGGCLSTLALACPCCPAAGYQLEFLRTHSSPALAPPQCEGMSLAGVLAVVVLAICFWPLAWVPCVMPECFENQQRPVRPPGEAGTRHRPPSSAAAGVRQ